MNDNKIINKELYFYNKNIQKTILAFSNIFTNFYVDIGSNDEEKLQSCGVINLNGDQSIINILSGGSQNEMINLPLLGIRFKGLIPNDQDVHGKNVVIREVYSSSKDPSKKVAQYNIKPMAYWANMSVEIVTSDEDHMYALLEQILTLFDPTLSLATSDKFNNWQRITTVELTDVSATYTNTILDNQAMYMTDLEFKVNIWLGLPSVVKKNIIKQIEFNIGNPSPTLRYDKTLHKLVPYIIPNGSGKTEYTDNFGGDPTIIQEEVTNEK